MMVCEQNHTSSWVGKKRRGVRMAEGSPERRQWRGCGVLSLRRGKAVDERSNLKCVSKTEGAEFAGGLDVAFERKSGQG